MTWTATATDSNAGNLDFQFSASRDGVRYRLVQDYDISNQMVWAAASKEGTYTIKVVARNQSTLETATATAPMTITSRIVGNMPVVSTTANPLVALYSAPGCPNGAYMSVRYGTGTNFSHTGSIPCTPNQSMNFYVGGMIPSSVYTMYYVIENASGSHPGPASVFTTGAVDPSLFIPSYSITAPPNNQSSNGQDVLLLDFLSPGFVPTYFFPTAMDLQGRIIWYYPYLGTLSEQASYFIRPIPRSGGHMLLILEDPATQISDQILREVDLAGNTVQQTSVTRVSEQLQALGKIGIIDFDHDAIRLPNGHTLVICAQENVYPAGTQGASGPIDIIGNAIVDLDANLQVTWSWSGYDHLDVNRPALLGETCAPNEGGCPPIHLASIANDWLHGNSLNYTPSDGSVIFSMRHQDWIIKIDYANGAGSGNVLWTLGLGGSFAINSSDPYPWFSHQHDAEYELGGTTLMSIYDNGNTRVSANPGVVENSRGMALTVDETNMVVTPAFVVDLGGYSAAVGSAQRLQNGNYFFESGYLGTPPNLSAQAAEYLPDGTQNTTEFNTGCVTYRGYRMTSLYQLQGSSVPARNADIPFFPE